MCIIHANHALHSQARECVLKAYEYSKHENHRTTNNIWTLIKDCVVKVHLLKISMGKIKNVSHFAIIGFLKSNRVKILYFLLIVNTILNK